MRLVIPEKESFDSKKFTIELTGRELKLIDQALWNVTIDDLNDMTPVWSVANLTVKKDLDPAIKFFDDIIVGEQE